MQPPNLPRDEEEGDPFDDREAGDGTTPVVLDLLQEAPEGIPNRLEPVLGFRARAVLT